MKSIGEYIKNEILETRRALHTIPETAFDEVKTCKYVMEKLISYGYNVESVAETGVIAFRKGEGNEGSAVAFRADMDGLSVKEETGLNYASKEEGKMHACGHDGHMAILLGLAKYISELNSIKRDIVFIFQPAEESIGGAEQIINEGILVKYNVGEIYGLHIMPEIKEGKVGIKEGALMAQVGNLDVIIKGKSGHGAMPDKSIDSIFIAAQIINSYQGIISRNIDPIESGVVTIGEIHGGDARNVIAGQVRLRGTIRAFDKDTYQNIKDRINKINEGYETIHEVKIETIIGDLYPAVINNKKLFENFKDILNEDEIENINPMMISEDFSYYQKEIPGFFFMLGSRNEERGYIYPLHNGKFNFNEEILIKGLDIYLRLCEKLEII